MKQPEQGKRVVLISLIIISTCFTCDYATLPLRRQLSEKANFSTRTPEEIFGIYILTSSKMISPEVSQIQAAEGAIFGSKGPGFIRFKASRQFIGDVLKQQYHYSPYVSIPCGYFLQASSTAYFIQEFPEKFEWWQPAETVSPICYRAQGYQADDLKYLLIDSKNNLVYFYNTATCGLCPD